MFLLTRKSKKYLILDYYYNYLKQKVLENPINISFNERHSKGGIETTHNIVNIDIKNGLKPKKGMKMLMINFLYRLFLTFNSTSLLIVIFLVKEQETIKWPQALMFIPDYASYIIYFLIPVFLTWLSLFLAKLLANDSLGKTLEVHEKDDGKEQRVQISKIIEVEQANNAFLPSYLGYFFVALSVPYIETLLFVFLILFLFTFFSQTLYFNPLFLLFRYQFYYLTTINKVKIFLITKKSLKDPSDINLPHLKRVNDFTFIDLGR